MKLVDQIETAEEPLDVILPLDRTDEMQRHFGIYLPDTDE